VVAGAAGFDLAEAPAPRIPPTGRLGQGELRQLAAAHLAARGEAAREPGTPIRYCATPATACVAAAPGRLCVVRLRRIVVPGHGKIGRMAIERGGL
jgi:hypothetical protein